MSNESRRKLLAAAGSVVLVSLGGLAIPGAAQADQDLSSNGGYISCPPGKPVKISSRKEGARGNTKHMIDGTSVATGGPFKKTYDYGEGVGFETVTGAVSGHWDAVASVEHLLSSGARC